MERIRAAFERSARALTWRPSPGRATGVSRTRIRQGLTCEIEEGPWRVVAHLSAPLGGNADAPAPGVFGRAAFGSCLAVGYVLHAAKLGVPITAIEVEVPADDDGALPGGSDTQPGYLEVRYTVTVESEAPEADVRRVLDEADAHSPYLDVFGRAQPCRRSERILKPRNP